MGGIGFPELLIVLVIVMILFGAGKIPGLGSAFGNTIRNFKRSMKESDSPDVSVENISQLSRDVSSDSVKTIPEALSSSGSKTAASPDEP
jgi:sec-independent protein translocase protein TatA